MIRASFSPDALSELQGESSGEEYEHVAVPSPEQQIRARLDSTVWILWSGGESISSRAFQPISEERASSLQNGNGTNNILVWGDDLAMNLAPVVYQTFKEHADQFNVISLKGSFEQPERYTYTRSIIMSAVAVLFWTCYLLLH